MKPTKIVMMALAGLALASPVANAQNTVDKQGRRQGHWIRTDKDGSKLFEADYTDGLETGTTTYYYPSGMVRIRNTYTEPGIRCTHEAFDEQGRLMATGEYTQRNRDGQWKFYSADGRLVKESAYRMGIKEGRHVVYDRQGDTAEVTHWQNNHRHGRWWRRMGKQGYLTANYVEGNLEGALWEYDDEGRIAREGNYQNGLKHGAYRYFTEGKLTVDERWHHGMMSERKILLAMPDDRYESIFDIVCLAPLGKNRVAVYLKDGTKLTVQESADAVFNRLGNGYFSTANSKSRILVANSSIQGIGKDNEGRETLLVDPQPADLTIYPDEDGLKMATSVLRSATTDRNED